jgi:hypothetical protein
MAKRKLRIGDLVKGKPNNGCAITDERMELGKIVGYREDLHFYVVKILSYPSNIGLIGKTYFVKTEDLGIVKNSDDTIVIYRNNNKVIALDKSTGEKAEARCNPTDKFDFHIGARLAFDRLMGGKNETVPKNTKEVKEVRRTAKVGEYVKIVEPVFSLGCYEKGEIYKIVAIYKGGNAMINAGGINIHLYNREYVVLENYQPEESEDCDDIDEAAKMTGHMIKALESEGGLSHCEAIDFVKDIALGRR